MTHSPRRCRGDGSPAGRISDGIAAASEGSIRQLWAENRMELPVYLPRLGRENVGFDLLHQGKHGKLQSGGL